MTGTACTHAAWDDLQWLQRFATRLAHDSDDAEDLVQETLVEAWRDPPQTQRSLRPWLGAVLRNRLRMQRRSRTRRARREEQAPAPDVAASPDAELSRVEVLQILLEEVRRLPEDDQRIIVRRFFEGESAAEIGRALDIPSATIRSRLHRSLGRLRRELDRRHGDRATWCAAVLALPRPGAAATANPAQSTSTMSITAKALVLTTVGGLSVGGWYAMRTPAEPQSTTEAPVAVAETPDEPVELSAQAKWEQRRTAIRTALTDTRDAEPDPAPTPDIKPAPPAEHERAHADFQELVKACLDDVGAGETGAITLQVREMGAPDVGVIYEDVQVVHTNLDGPEVVECLVQSMYGYVGDAPEECYEYESTRTMQIGKPTESDARDEQIIGAIVGAHMSESRVCEGKADDPVEGLLRLAMTVGPEGLLESSIPETNPLPDVVVDCVVERSLAWKFPDRVAGKTFVHEMKFPVPGR